MKLASVAPNLRLLQPALPPAPPSLPTRNKRVLFVTNRPDDSLQRELSHLFQTSKLEFAVIEGRSPRTVDSICVGIESNSFDYVLAAVGFMDHSTDGRLSSSCRKVETPYLRVQKGRPAACLRAFENFFRTELDKGKLLEGMKEAKALASTKPEEASAVSETSSSVEDSENASEDRPEAATVAVPDLSSFVFQSKGQKFEAWSAAEVYALYLMKAAKTSASDIQGILRSAFNTNRTEKTIHQTYYKYFVSEKRGNLPPGYEELKAKGLSLNALLSSIPAPQISTSAEPELVETKAVPKAPRPPKTTSGEKPEKLNITYRTVSTPFLKVLYRNRERGPLGTAPAMVAALVDMGLDPELMGLLQVQNCFSNARYDLKIRGLIKNEGMKWWITEVGVKALEEGRIPEAPPVKVVLPPSPPPAPIVETKVEAPPVEVVEAPPPPPPPASSPVQAIVPVAPALKAAPTKIAIEIISDGVKIDSVMITGSSGSGGLIDTKRSFAEILAFLYG